jgi:AsmA protein
MSYPCLGNTAADKAEGIISMDYTVKGDLDNMAPIYESLHGGGNITPRDIKVKGLKCLVPLARKQGRSINNPSFKDIVVHSTINNNVIDIKPFTFKVSLFRPTIKGTTSFNGLLDLRVRLKVTSPQGL